MNGALQQVVACREKAESLKAAKEWAAAAAAYEELARAWVAAAGLATTASGRADRLKEHQAALDEAAVCRKKAGKGKAPGKRRNEGPQGWGWRKKDKKKEDDEDSDEEDGDEWDDGDEWPEGSLHAQLAGDDIGEQIIAQIHGSLRTSGVTWNDIGGQEKLVEDLKTILAQAVMTRPDGSRPDGAGQILMVGPPGTGKTMLVSAMANSISKAGAFFSPKLADIKGHYVGMTEKAISLLFETARAKAPSMVFIDEVDCLCRARDGSTGGSGELGVLLAEMDGIGAKGGGEAPFVLSAAATNAPWALDAALMSRFSGHVVLVGAADAAGRRQILEKLLHKYECAGEVLDWLSADERTEGFSGRDLESLAKNAVQAMQKEMNPEIGKWEDIGEVQGRVQKERPLERGDFDKALGLVKASITPEIAADYEAWIRDRSYKPKKRQA